MPRVTFAPASEAPLERITAAFNLAFTGYYFPMTQTAAGLEQMMRENDVRLSDSSLLLVDGALAGVGLVGVRETRGWIAGMGVAPQWRGQGIGAALLGRLLDRMRAIGLREAQLEALNANTPALALYRRMGFRESRSLLVYQGPLANAERARLGEAMAPDERARAVAPRLALGAFDAFHAVRPAWQRERPTLERIAGALDGLGLWQGGELRAYLLYARQSGGFAVLDVGARDEEPTARRDAVARLLLALTNRATEAAFRAINTPPGDPLRDALDLLGCPVEISQREMTRSLP